MRRLTVERCRQIEAQAKANAAQFGELARECRRSRAHAIVCRDYHLDIAAIADLAARLLDGGIEHITAETAANEVTHEAQAEVRDL